MNTKLTLRLDEGLIENAKLHAAQAGKSVSQLVADYFSLLSADSSAVEITPRARALRGALSTAGVDESDYRQFLLEKHG